MNILQPDITLFGQAGNNGVNVWLEYLQNFKSPYNKSQVIANHWLDLLFGKLTLNYLNEALSKDGYIDDILSIIDTFSTCIIHFNPLKSFKSGNKFKHNDDSSVCQHLKKFVTLLKIFA